MTVQELIDILKEQPPNLPVYLEYDSMCVVYENFTIVKAVNKEGIPDEFDRNGIYLMCESKEEAEYFFGLTSSEWNGKIERYYHYDNHDVEIVFSKEND
jgi:hypothetical protein